MCLTYIEHAARGTTMRLHCRFCFGLTKPLVWITKQNEKFLSKASMASMRRLCRFRLITLGCLQVLRLLFAYLIFFKTNWIQFGKQVQTHSYNQFVTFWGHYLGSICLMEQWWIESKRILHTYINRHKREKEKRNNGVVWLDIQLLTVWKLWRSCKQQPSHKRR